MFVAQRVKAGTGLVSIVSTDTCTNTISSDLYYFSDPQWTNYPGRFYRLRSP
jgi:hypothetical protein